MIKILLLSIVLIAIVFLLFSVNILFKKKGEFPSLHISENKEMTKRGITCATSQDRAASRKKGAF